MTFMTIPSTISGGPASFRCESGRAKSLARAMTRTCLLAFYQHSYEDHINSLKKGGIVLYDSDHVEPKPDGKRTIATSGCRFRPDGRGHWRNGKGQRQEYFCARVAGEDV